MYTMVIRPIFTSSSTVWWLSIRYDVSRMELSKVRCLACLAITWVTKTASTAAMEVLLGLLLFGWSLRQRPRQRSADQCVPSCGDLNPLPYITPKIFGMWNTNPSCRWDLTGCYKGKHTTGHSWSSSLTSVHSRTGSTQTTKWA